MSYDSACLPYLELQATMLSEAMYLLLPALTWANIRLHMKASSVDRRIEYLGANVDVVGDAEIYAFGLFGDRLKAAVEAYSGAEPAEVYVRSPTAGNDFEDLYLTNNWNQVTRRSIPMNGDVVYYSAEPVDKASDIIYNDNDERIARTTDIEADYVKLVTAYWGRHKILSTSDNIIYVVDFGSEGEEDEVTFEERFGENVDWSKVAHARQSVDLELDEGQQLEVTLKAKRQTVDFQVNYTVSLDGDVACYYPEGHKGQKYWAYDVNEVLTAGGMKNEMEMVENIEVIYDSDPELTVEEL